MIRLEKLAILDNMVKSPAMLTSAGGSGAITATKAKVQAELPNASKAAVKEVKSDLSEGEPILELAEQLNLETKRKYVKGQKVGSGTYANVFLGHLAEDTSNLVAIKKIKVNPDWKDGLAMDAIREIKFLQELSHPNIIALLAVYSSKNQNLNLVLEYLPLGDLEMLIKDVNHVNYSAADMKAWMGMLCRGVWFCHENWVLHRDIKPNNLLIAADGEIKLADFGLARSFADPYQAMTTQVITRWYRPPELFYNAKHYSGAVDIWSVGTVFAELIKRAPYLPGKTDLDQLDLICQWVGTPTEDNWPGVSKLKDYVVPSKGQTKHLLGHSFYSREFGAVGENGVDLLMAMLKLDPRKRVTARQILQHKWWRVEPKTTRKEDLPRKGGGQKKMGDDLKRRGDDLEGGRIDKVSRKLDFSIALKG